MSEDPRPVDNNNDPSNNTPAAAGAGAPVMPNLARLERTNRLKKGEYYYFKYDDERPFVFVGRYKEMRPVHGASIKIVHFEDVTCLNDGEHYDEYKMTSNSGLYWKKPTAGGKRRTEGRRSRRRRRLTRRARKN